MVKIIMWTLEVSYFTVVLHSFIPTFNNEATKKNRRVISELGRFVSQEHRHFHSYSAPRWPWRGRQASIFMSQEFPLWFIVSFPIYTTAYTCYDASIRLLELFKLTCHSICTFSGRAGHCSPCWWYSASTMRFWSCHCHFYRCNQFHCAISRTRCERFSSMHVNFDCLMSFYLSVSSCYLVD